MGDSSSFEILSRGGGSGEPRQLAEDSFREDDSLESGLESMRIKLAVMKVREELNRDEPPSSIDLAPVNKKLSDNDADENEDFKLEAITELETQLEQIQKFEKQRGGEISDRRTAPVTKVTVTKHPVINRNSSASLVNQIRSHVSALVNLFSSVFEALLIKLEGTEDPPPEINPMMARKAREFEARFQRQIFEGKQKALVMESASLKHKLHRHDERQLGAYLKSLHQVLKCCLSALTAYTHHLPFTSASPQLIFPPPLKALAALVKVASKEAFEVLSNDEGSVAQQLSEDADRLVFTFDKFSAKTKDQKQSQEMRLLQRLARKTFGSGGDDSSPIVTPVKKPSRAKKQKEIIPRSNRLLRQRAQHSKAKIELSANSQSPSRAKTPKPSSERSPTHDARKNNSPAKSLPKSSPINQQPKLVVPTSHSPARNELTPSIGKTPDQTDLRPISKISEFTEFGEMSINPDHLVDSHAKNSLKMMAFEQESPRTNITRSTQDRVAAPPVDHFTSSPFGKTSSIKKKSGVKLLDIDSVELEHLVAHKSLSMKPVGAIGAPPSGQNPMLLVGEISQCVVNEVVAKVCEELMAMDIVSSIVNVELSK